ncbi:MAG TPA: N-acetyl-gamma-glutamyl-phosphate reductase [Puia sp.]|nr:N-acetyl-gamma-glutamyl-phosphate reductase [Puia sp.]
MATSSRKKPSLRAGIIGGAGYTGGEMIRLLINHPAVDITFIHSKSNAGKFLYEIHEDLAGDTDLRFDAEWRNDIDVLFLCLGHGEAKKFLEGEGAVLAGGDTAPGSAAGIRIIDLSQDYRLHVNGQRPALAVGGGTGGGAKGGTDGGQAFVYGLPELNREEIRVARHIANPGCFATAIQLGLLPMAREGLLRDTDIYTTGITGSTGAGQSLSATSHFSWRANNIQAYKTLTHQHLKEVGQSLQQLEAGFGVAGSGEDGSASGGGIHFVPWRGDFTRGIFVSSQLRTNASLAGLTEIYKEYYNDHPFTLVSPTPISLKQVVNTNKCLIQLEKQGEQLVVHTAIDNLVKGACGQAVQNMNLLFGLEETEGLHLKANAF